eukprot:11727278-Alexandrium_andersonii.AAC.1
MHPSSPEHTLQLLSARTSRFAQVLAAPRPGPSTCLGGVRKMPPTARTARPSSSQHHLARRARATVWT